MNTEQFRVTSIPLINAELVIFVGVPLQKDSYKLNSGKYTVSVKAHPDALPISPAVGQHWQIEGPRSLTHYESNGFDMQQHVYDTPIKVNCTLPQDGEQIISFIAKEADFKGIGESKARRLWNELDKDFYATVRDCTPESRKRLKSLLSEESIDALFKGYAKYANLRACACKIGCQSITSLRQFSNA
jgi:exodeoxyribonuclease V alpha subunit